VNTVLEVMDLNVTFPTRAGAIRASQQVSFRMQKGEISVLIGETGSGKSVIGLAVLHLLPEAAIISGKINYNGREILSMSEKEFSRFRGRDISLVPQNPSGSLDPLMRCGKQISESLEIRGISNLKQSTEVENILSNLQFSDPKLTAASFPHELSGGMRQRVTTGIALASEPKLLVSDEPTKGLDYLSRKTSMKMFLHLKHIRKDTHLLITHDLDLARMIGDTIHVLYSGEIIESGPVDEIFSDPHHPYTEGLIAALPRNGMKAMPGMCPGLIDLPSGCYFYSRCPYQCEQGKTIHPAIIPVNGRRSVRCHRFSR